MANLGRHVQWQDKDGGWHTGQVVTMPTVSPYPPFTVCPEVECGRQAFNSITRVLVRESCNRVLTWVPANLLQNWPMRDEWEVEGLEVLDQ